MLTCDPNSIREESFDRFLERPPAVLMRKHSNGVLVSLVNKLPTDLALNATPTNVLIPEFPQLLSKWSHLHQTKSRINTLGLERIHALCELFLDVGTLGFLFSSILLVLNGKLVLAPHISKCNRVSGGSHYKIRRVSQCIPDLLEPIPIHDLLLGVDPAKIVLPLKFNKPFGTTAEFLGLHCILDIVIMDGLVQPHALPSRSLQRGVDSRMIRKVETVV